MKTFELYAMSLHGEKLENMGATDIQIKLIEIFKTYNTDELIQEIRNLGIIRTQHDTGLEFCGRLRSNKSITTIMLAENGYIYDSYLKKWFKSTL